MAVYLHRIFPGISMRPPHKHHQNLVDHFPLITDISVMDGMAVLGRKFFLPGATIYFINNGKGIRPCHPDNADPGITHPCGDRGDGAGI